MANTTMSMARAFHLHCAFVLIICCHVALVDAAASTHSPCSLQRGACVCTASHCDTIEPIGPHATDTAVVYTTTKSGQRMERTTVNIIDITNAASTKVPNESGQALHLDVDIVDKHQRIIGFGGAFTDAAAIVLGNLTSSLQTHVMEAYYGDYGIEYTLGRIPMAACDFSEEEYSYDDSPDDFSLSNFSITHDERLKLPMIRRANNLTTSRGESQLTLFASPWSPPAWMKTNGKRVKGQLLGEAGGEYYKAWALYFDKFLSSYEAAGVPIWGVTAQNEPGNKDFCHWDSCFFNATMQRDFIKQDLGPLLRREHPNVKIMMLDDQFSELERWSDEILGDKEAAQYVDGIAFHWYEELDEALDLHPLLSKVHNKYPEPFLLATEACEGYLPWNQGPKIGDFTRALHYARDIVKDLLHSSIGWTDWNLILNSRGGPNHASNWVDAPMIVDDSFTVVYKQPMFYAMGHFSKFIRPNATRVTVGVNAVATSASIGASFGNVVDAVATLADDASTVTIVLYNEHPMEHMDVTLRIKQDSTTVDNRIATVPLPPSSIVTVIAPLQRK